MARCVLVGVVALAAPTRHPLWCADSLGHVYRTGPGLSDWATSTGLGQVCRTGPRLPDWASRVRLFATSLTKGPPFRCSPLQFHSGS
ncbi:unnamed protein product [Lampetra planeri]